MRHVLVITSGRAASTAMARAMASPGALESAETLWGRKFPAAELAGVVKALFRPPSSGVAGFLDFFLQYRGVPKIVKMIAPRDQARLQQLVGITRAAGGTVVGLTRTDVGAAAQSMALAAQTGVFDPDTQQGRAAREDLLPTNAVAEAEARIRASMTAIAAAAPDINITYEQLVGRTPPPSGLFRQTTGHPWPQLTPRP